MEDRIKKDFLDRKVNAFDKIFTKFFEAVQKDSKSFFIVILVFTNIVIFYKYTRSLEIRLDDNKDYSDKIINEIKNQLQPELDRSIEDRTNRIEEKVDSASYNLGQLKDIVLKKEK